MFILLVTNANNIKKLLKQSQMLFKSREEDIPIEADIKYKLLYLGGK